MQNHSIKVFEEKASAWLIDSLEFFNPLRHLVLDDIMNDLKAMGELVLLCALKHERANGSLPSPYEKIVKRLYAEVFCAKAYQEIIYRRPNTVLHMLTYVSFRVCGFEHKFYRKRLERLFKKGYVFEIERVPYRNMDLALMLEKGKFNVAFPQLEFFFEQTMLTHHPNAYLLNTSDVYAITHILFYYSDFKLRKMRLSEADIEYLRRSLPNLLAFYIYKQNWDVVGELLICFSILDLHHDSNLVGLYELAWKCFLGSQDASGFVRGPEFSEEACQKLPPKGRKEYLYRANYHTTIVGLIAATISQSEIAVHE